MDRVQIKELAKRQINGQLGIFLLIYLIIYGISFLTSSLSPVVVYILGIILEISLCSIYLKLADGIEPKVMDLFEIFKNGKLCLNGILLYVLITVFTFLWSILLIVPGIIKFFSYSMAPLILVENEYYMTPMDAIRESQRIMNGHKMELFVLTLSFIGWIFLAAFTCGVLVIYIEPYMNMSLINFYNSIKDKPEIS